MRLLKLQVAIVAMVLTVLPFVGSILLSTTVYAAISGTLQNGYRILDIAENAKGMRFTVYRGDYIKFDIGRERKEITLKIPSLQIKKEVTEDIKTTPYFKMKKVGQYPFTLGSASGTIEVIEYLGAEYQKLTAFEAMKLIKDISPVILDVRTPREYSMGHLENSILLPVQELQQRYPELLQYKNKDLFIYCATGNRSTVAAKILIDHGFTRIHNLQNGIFDWVKNGLPVVR